MLLVCLALQDSQATRDSQEFRGPRVQEESQVSQGQQVQPDLRAPLGPRALRVWPVRPVTTDNQEHKEPRATPETEEFLEAPDPPGQSDQPANRAKMDNLASRAHQEKGVTRVKLAQWVQLAKRVNKGPRVERVRPGQQARRVKLVSLDPQEWGAHLEPPDQQALLEIRDLEEQMELWALRDQWVRLVIPETRGYWAQQVSLVYRGFQDHRDRQGWLGQSETRDRLVS